MVWEAIQKGEEGAELQLKGFIYPSPDGEWILSQEPNLRSCCVGAAHKASSQVVLQGNFSEYSSDIPLFVRGIFHCTEGKYTLSDAQAIQKHTFPTWTLCLGIVCLLICIAVFIRYWASTRASSSSLKR
jgi:hypothetical protein